MNKLAADEVLFLDRRQRGANVKAYGLHPLYSFQPRLFCNKPLFLINGPKESTVWSRK